LGATNKVVAAGIAVVAVAAAPASACANVILGKSIDGVSLGTSQAQVERTLGKPSHVEGPFAGGITAWSYGGALKGTISFNSELRVEDVATRSPKQKTSKGIGVGASLSAFRHDYPKANCHRQGVFNPLCEITTGSGAHKVATTFYFERSKLWEIEVS
jgi:hypothetical protein